jgi:hypothetical protein
MDGRGSIPMRGRHSSSRPRTVSGAHPASYPVNTGEMCPWKENNLGVKLTTHMHPVAESKGASTLLVLVLM